MYYTLNMPQDATLMGAKELLIQKSAIINSALVHIA